MVSFGFWDFAILLVSLLCIVTYYFYRKNDYFKNLGLKYAKGYPFVGNMLWVYLRKQHIIDLLQDVYDEFPEERYAGMLNLVSPALVIRDPELLRKIMVKDFDHFVDHIQFASEEADPLSAKMVFAMRGETWKAMRSTLSPAFTSSKMRAMLPFMQECVENLVADFNTQIDNLNNGKDYLEIEIKDPYTRYTNDVIASCAFGIKTNSLAEKDNTFYLMAKDTTIITALDFVKVLMFLVFPAVLMKLFKIQLGRSHVTDFFRNLFNSNMKERIDHNIIRQDMIHILMLAKQGKLEDDSNSNDLEKSDLGRMKKKPEWDDDDIMAQALVFLFAGFDSSANLISFMSYELAVNPEVQRRLQEEIDESLKSNNGVVDYHEIHNLKYLDMVVSETLRLWPGISNLDRICVKPYEFPPQNDNGGKTYKVQVGDQIFIPTNQIHRDPQFHENPNKFDPERFSDVNKPLMKPFTYFPFGAGPRQCLASRFALMESKVLMVNLLSKFDFIRIPKTPVPLKLQIHIFSMIAEGGFWVGLQKRKNNTK